VLEPDWRAARWQERAIADGRAAPTAPTAPAVPEAPEPLTSGGVGAARGEAPIAPRGG
jgi:hypothetical protein